MSKAKTTIKSLFSRHHHKGKKDSDEPYEAPDNQVKPSPATTLPKLDSTSGNQIPDLMVTPATASATSTHSSAKSPAVEQSLAEAVHQASRKAEVDQPYVQSHAAGLSKRKQEDETPTTVTASSPAVTTANETNENDNVDKSAAQRNASIVGEGGGPVMSATSGPLGDSPAF